MATETKTMNLNRIKKGFTKTNPERGLSNLPGAQKSERRNDESSTIRIKGRYIPPRTDKAGLGFGLLGYSLSWIYTVFLIWSVIAYPSGMFSPLTVFLIGLTLVHGCAMAADSLRHSEAPWARRGVKLFWIVTVILSIYGLAL